MSSPALAQSQAPPVCVTVRQDDKIIDTYDVPAGMTVRVGGVKLQGSYRSALMPAPGPMTARGLL